jgi:hypothetical protein
MVGSVGLPSVSASGRSVVCQVEHNQQYGHEQVGGADGARVPGTKFFATIICFTCPAAAPGRKIDDTMIVASSRRCGQPEEDAWG